MDIYHTLKHIYVSPLEYCNLNCKYCYTNKTCNVISEDTIKRFILKYNKYISKYKVKLQTVTFCGGEVFLLNYFPKLVNWCNENEIFVQIITNGTIDRLKEMKNPNNVNLIYSIDTFEEFHDNNRGKGKFKITTKQLKKAQNLGFHTEIYSIINKKNVNKIDEFIIYAHEYLKSDVTLLPMKNPKYLSLHPISNKNIKESIKNELSDIEVEELMLNYNTFPTYKTNCYSISLMSDGWTYSCCEGIKPIGHISDKISKIVNNYLKRAKESSSNKCLEPDFACGLECMK